MFYKLKISLILRVVLVVLVSPGLSKPTKEPSKSSKGIIGNKDWKGTSYKSSELAISDAVLEIVDFGGIVRLVQKYDKSTGLTGYWARDSGTWKVGPLFYRNGSSEVGREVIVFRDRVDPLLPPSLLNSLQQNIYTVLRLDTNSKAKEPHYFIFKAILRERGGVDGKKVVVVKGKEMVLEWNVWQEFLISSKSPMSPSNSKAGMAVSEVPPGVSSPQGRSMGGKSVGVGAEQEYPSSESTEELDFTGGDENREADFVGGGGPYSGEGPEPTCTGRGCARVVTDDNVDRDDDGNPDYAGDGENDFDIQRAKAQRLRWKNVTKLSFEPMITTRVEIYSHVQWYRLENYKNDTEITVERSHGVINKFKGYSYGPCKAKTVRPTVLNKAKITKDIVDFYVILLREYCKPEAVVAYNELFLSGYVSLNGDHSIDIVKTSSMLKKKELAIGEMDEMQKIFMLTSYSQVYISMIKFPTEPLDPHYTQISSRVFILINTVLHIEDQVRVLCPQHFKLVLSHLLMKVKAMMSDVLCEYLDVRSRDLTVKKRIRSIALYSAVALLILLEHIAATLKDSRDSAVDAHVLYKTHHNKTRRGHLANIKAYRHNQELYKQCVLKRDIL